VFITNPYHYKLIIFLLRLSSFVSLFLSLSLSLNNYYQFNSLNTIPK